MAREAHYVIIRVVTDKFLGETQPVGVYVFNKGGYCAGCVMGQHEVDRLGLQKFARDLMLLREDMLDANKGSYESWMATKADLREPFMISGPFVLRCGDDVEVWKKSTELYEHYVKGR